MLVDVVMSAAALVGRRIEGDESIREYVAARVAHLSSCLGEPGYEEALVATRDSIALEMGMRVVGLADAADAFVLGALRGGLDMAARSL